jgi:outer membrane receptor for ferrienterochelin and colicins
VQGQRNYDVAVYLDDQRTSSNLGAYVQDDWTILKNLRLNAGLRYDYYDTFGSSLNPRVALIYNPWNTTTLKLLYGEAFRAPNAFELYYQDGGRTQEAPKSLEPETIRTFEFVFEQEIAKRLRVTVAAFDNRIDHLINQVKDPANGLLVYKNMTGADAQGVEWEVEGSTESGIKGRLSYTLERATDRDTGKGLINSPQDMVKLNLILPAIREKLFLGIEYQYMGHRRTIAGSYASPFMTTNLTLFGTKIVPGLDFSASVYNIFNQKYGDPGGPEQVLPAIQQDGRTFWVKLTYRF